MCADSDIPSKKEKSSLCISESSNLIRLAAAQLSKESKIEIFSPFSNLIKTVLVDGKLNKKYRETLDLAAGVQGRLEFLSASEWAEKLDLKVTSLKKHVKDDILLRSLCVYLDTCLGISVLEACGFQEQVNQKNDEQSLSFSFTSQSDVDSEDKNVLLEKPNRVELSQIFRKIVAAEQAGVVESDFVAYELSALLDAKRVIRVPCFDHFRLVAVEYCLPWVIFINGFQRFTKLSKKVIQKRKLGKQTEENQDPIQDAEDDYTFLLSCVLSGEIEFVVARRWTLCTGQDNLVFKNKLLRSIALIILTRPRISRTALESVENLTFLMTPVDLDTLLLELGELKIIKKIPLKKSKKLSSGKKRLKTVDVVYSPVLSLDWKKLFVSALLDS